MSDKKENTSDNSNLFSNCYTMFKDEIRDLKLTPSNVSKVLSKAMKVVEISELKGVEQKKLAKDLVSKAVSQLPDGEEKTVLKMMLENDVLEDMVETIVLATKGELPINQIVEKIKTRCCGLF
jgi:hypothetical protein